LRHEITDADRAERDELEVVRMETKLTKKIGQLLGLLSPMVMAKLSGSLDYGVICEQFNTSEDHPAKVIERLDAMISTQVTAELEGLMERTQALKGQKACRASKSIAMERSIDMVQSRQCQIDREVLTEHSARSWAQGVGRFEEARDGEEFYLETLIGEAEQEELETFMLAEKKI
jgi:hypothetical protein